jgi:hypothetical protein
MRVNNNDKAALAEGGAKRFVLHNPIADRSRLLAVIGVRSPFVLLRDRVFFKQQNRQS